MALKWHYTAFLLKKPLHCPDICDVRLHANCSISRLYDDETVFKIFVFLRFLNQRSYVVNEISQKPFEIIDSKYVTNLFECTHTCRHTHTQAVRQARTHALNLHDINMYLNACMI